VDKATDCAFVVIFLSLSERIAVMRKAIVLFILAVAWASSAQAQLSFTADFVQDGAYENSWPMKAGDVVSVDIYVSNVPEPGLIAMGFKLTYDSSKLEVVPAGTAVDTGNWSVDFLDAGALGEIEMGGARLEEGLTGLAGNDIRLGTVTLSCISSGTSVFLLLDREGDWFVLDSEEEIVLDDDIGVGVLLGTIRPPVPGNVNGDGLVDLADAILALRFMAKMHTPYIHGNADVNGDGLIDMAEAIYILQRLSSVR
jgi:hypothetical protein